MPGRARSTPADDLRPRGAALEYWFFNFRAGDLSFLVDFIARRAPTPTVEIRVSRWVRGAGAVARETAPHSVGRGLLQAPAGWVEERRSAGSVGDCRWDLAWDPGRFRVDPRPGFLGPLHPFDLELIALPGVSFTGWVEVAGERFEVEDRPGAVTHYWGRRLPDRWIWVSACEFPDQPGRRVEAGLAWTSSWGGGPRLPIGYLWTANGSRDDVTISPVTGLVRLRRPSAEPGIAAAVMTSIRLFGSRHRLDVSAPDRTFNDLGEEIRQTLLADLTIDGVRSAPGTAGLEFRRG